ncbi:ferredoxin [Candidatus Woesearchaeota archaeon]|nr:ferredoxin [Candidatus Woesearchaeota archaeon]
MSFEIKIDRDKCVGCGACAAVCDNFEMKDGIAYSKNSKVEKIGCNQEAADVCGLEAIEIKENEKSRR